MVRFDLNAAVWRVAIERGLVKAWAVPGWGLASTDPECQVPAGWAVTDGRTVRSYRTLTHRELSAQTLHAIRRQVEWNR